MFAGCADVRVTSPLRSATEQFLLSQAAEEAIEGFSFDPLFGRYVFVDSTYFEPANRDYVLGAFRAELFQAGAQLSKDPENAEIILEIRSGGVGIDQYEKLVGVPSISAPAGSAAVAGADSAALSTLISPELAITKNRKQISFASLAYVAYWKDTGEIVASEGPKNGRAYREDWWIFGFGPRTIGNIIPTKTEPIE